MAPATPNAPPNRHPGGWQIERYTMETQSYWFSDMGLWGSNPVQTYEFGPKHHPDMHEVFDFVHDTQLGDFMAYLQKRPHERTGAANEVCTTCEDLSEEFGVIW